MIQSLHWAEHVRKKPGMYIGSTDEKGLSTCITELVKNSVEQHLAGFCTSVTVALHSDGSASVKDDGSGIRVTPLDGFDVPFLELALTTCNAPRVGRSYP